VLTTPSASVLATLRREAALRDRPSKGIAVLADPVFEAADARVRRAVDRRRQANASARPSLDAERSIHARAAVDQLRAGGTLARLAFSRDEAANIAALAGADAWVADGFGANRKAVLSHALEDYRVVHFATHGLVNDAHPELSGLLLSLVSEDGAPQDGFLRLQDIVNLELRADLVVLSACRTALGKDVRGEGLLSLTRSFMFAGTPRVVASLWQVGDAATAELMKRLYTGLLTKGMSPAAALRAAQRELAADPRWSAPYYWAGFVLQGDWR
jgi:CHAT domain-containing protein